MRSTTWSTAALLWLAVLGCDDGSQVPLEDFIGMTCESNENCPEPLFCSRNSPNFVCSAECSSDSHCISQFGLGFDCVNGETRCARRCDTELDCPDSDCVVFSNGVSYCANR